MPIVSLSSYRKEENSDDEDTKKRNQYYAGGINSQGGGSGVSVVGGPDESGEAIIHIRVFKNGYIVDKEDFCPKDDTEEHKQFYESVVEGYVPRVLESAVRDQGKKVVVENHPKEDYVAPPSRFSGKGNRIQDSIPLPITPRTMLSDKRLHYVQSKPKAGVRILLSSQIPVILEVTEDWDNEDVYAAVREQGNASAWELHDGFHDRPIPCDHTKVFRAGYGGSSVRQVCLWSVCCIICKYGQFVVSVGSPMQTVFRIQITPRPPI